MVNDIWKNGYGIAPRNLFKDESLSMPDKLVMAYLLTYTGQGNNFCWPSIKTIAADTGLSRRCVVSSLKTLEEQKYITKEKLNENPFNRSNKYKVNIFCTLEGAGGALSEGARNDTLEGAGGALSYINNNSYKDNIISTTREVISYLNEKTGSSFKYQTKETQRNIHARITEGFTVDEFKQVIDFKHSEWKDDERWSQYLRPSTLFGTKFESYLQATKRPKPNTEPAIKYDTPRFNFGKE